MLGAGCRVLGAGSSRNSRSSCSRGAPLLAWSCRPSEPVGVRWDVPTGLSVGQVCVLKQEPEKEARRPCLGSVCPAPRGTEASPARKLDGTGGWRQTDSTQTLISARVRATGLASVPSRASVRPVGLPVSVSPNPEPVHWNFPIRRARGNRRSTVITALPPRPPRPSSPGLFVPRAMLEPVCEK